ncbi:2-oxoglutarate and iron-dependent oxygenase domain-containing protein 3 [Tetranychus urticae]|uniref:Fe2OG dioxygenase domain-containing protein n=1 Tax=Tetranychus urticae TaxID=32264 RepID=T1L5W9_TETUR|nr:2-oxoglutarate and iron-dependent oxygenase domain-containing protein 3 [Tetranychus urticae]XP_025018309.1 2-oxoglutarate and iron-dependent oxygenase domain-containing protein 3 [Tetranychus urticae]
MAPNAGYKEINVVHRASAVNNNNNKNGSSKKDVQLNGDRKQRPSNNKKTKSKSTSSWKPSNSTLMTLFSFIFFVSGLIFYYIPIEKLIKAKPIASDKEDFKWMVTTDQHVGPNVFLHDVPCHRPGYRRERAAGAEPQRCGTLIYDELVSLEEAARLRQMAAKLVYEIGETNPYSRESINLHWVNLHTVFKRGYKEKVFNETDFKLVKKASERAKTVIAETFGIPRNSLHFTTVAQFTRYRPMTRYSQFRHVDKVRVQSLIVTSILWLSTYDYDFGGGTTSFLTAPDSPPYTPYIVQPKINRFAAWTSGWENPHEVMQLLWGERLALIFAFTVNPNLGEKNMEALRTWAQALPDNPFYG